MFREEIPQMRRSGLFLVLLTKMVMGLSTLKNFLAWWQNAAVRYWKTDFDKKNSIRNFHIYSKDNYADEELREAFRLLDRNEDGYITFEELRLAQKSFKFRYNFCWNYLFIFSLSLKSFDMNMKNEEIKKLVAEIDLDQDGKICFEEFVLAMIGKWMNKLCNIFLALLFCKLLGAF